MTVFRLLAPVLLLSLTTSLQAEPPVLVIDPGHGGSSRAGHLGERSSSSPNNASSPGGLKEKDLTLEFSFLLKEAILQESTRRGATVGVVMTREKDVNLDFLQRAAICNRPDTACVVSIHFNASGGSGATGSLALIAAENRNPNYRLDRIFAEGLAEACAEGVKPFLPGSKCRGVITDDHLHGGAGSNFFFQLLRHPQLTKVPKCFLEVEFIDNVTVEKAILSGDRARKFRAVVKPIAVYLLDYLAANGP